MSEFSDGFARVQPDPDANLHVTPATDARLHVAAAALDEMSPRGLEIWLRDYLMARAQEMGDVDHREGGLLESFVLGKWEFIVNDEPNLPD